MKSGSGNSRVLPAVPGFLAGDIHDEAISERTCTMTVAMPVHPADPELVRDPVLEEHPHVVRLEKTYAGGV